MMMPDPPRDALLLAENAALREINQTLQAQIEGLTQRLDRLSQDNLVLRLKVDAMARKLFGRSSEKLDLAQLQMVFDALQNPPPEDDAAKLRQKHTTHRQHRTGRLSGARAQKVF